MRGMKYLPAMIAGGDGLMKRWALRPCILLAVLSVCLPVAVVAEESWMAQWITAPAATAGGVGLTVTKATYRTLDGAVSVDVTATMQKVVADKRLPFTVRCEHLGGDPAPNTIKELVVEYVWRGKAGTARARDFEVLETPGIQVGIPAPWFRKEFDLAAAPQSATVRVHSPGYFELYINGVKAGGDVLTPAVSDLKLQTFVVTYNVTKLLKPGRNCLGLWLGTGWSDAIALRAQLDAVVASKPVTLGTDTTWKTRPSGLSRIGQRKWNNYGGERLDAREHLANWNLAGVDESTWSLPVEAAPPAGRVSNQPCPRNRIGERMPACGITPLGEGRYEIDFGRNLTGCLHLRMPTLERGRKVRMYFADCVFPNGVQSSPLGNIGIQHKSCVSFPRADGGKNVYQHFNQVSDFISAGQAGEAFQQKFNYAGFRYVVVEGLPSAPKKEDATAFLVESDLEDAGFFECSDELINRIHRVNRWTLRCLNLGGYMVDCPHRERLGYGDGQVSIEGMMMNFKADAFYEKWVADWRQTQNPQTGAMPNVAPWGGGGGGPPWAGVIAALPWQHYLHYGNRRILDDNYPAARRYSEYLDSRSKDDVLRAWGGGFDFIGDWVPPNRGMDTRSWPSKEMAELFCNCYRVYLWQLVCNMADALGRSDEAAHARERMAAIRSAVHAAYFDAANKRYVIDEQIYYAMPLMTGVTPEPERPAVLANLVKCIVEKNKGHLDTGMLGTRFLIDYLSQAGRDDLVLSIYQQKTYPGWGYMVEQGATTLWEQWNGHWSQIHSCFASADNWLYRGLAGIRPDPTGPGFKKIIIKPAVVGDITWVKSRHETAYGRIVSNWQRTGNNLTMDVTIPSNTTATVFVPGEAPRQVGPGNHQFRTTSNIGFR